MKKANLMLVLGLASGMFMISCGGSSASDKGDSTSTASAEVAATAVYDLSTNGIPLSITGPGGAEIKKGMMAGAMDGVTIQNWEIKKDKFRLDITMLDKKSEETIADLITNSKDVDKEDEGFEIVREEAQGYIYKKKSTDGTDYSFHYVIMKGDRAIEISTGLNMSDYTLEEVEAMFKACKEAK